jgi:PhoPQ-activated pathogenicity-related protein
MLLLRYWTMKRLLLALLPVALVAADYTPLDRYVAAPDSSYRYELVRTISGLGTSVYQLDLISQTWLSAAEVDRPEWRHWLTIVKPDRLTSATAVLLIDGGSNKTNPDTPNPLLVALAAQLGTVFVQLNEVPNQPLKFAGESGTRSEDAIIAYSWDRFLKTGDDRWPARLPMTKAAVRAMDAATDFLSKLPEAPAAIRHFILTGGSKRGWTTWTAAAVDPRVIAIAPLVIDVLNTRDSFIHHWRSYGFWAPAVKDYVDAGIMDWFGAEQIAALFEIEDPFAYRERLTMPKYLINSTGDQFFLPDSSRFYFDQLPGEKYLRYVPNTGHELSGIDAPLNLVAWVRAILENYPRPRFYWRADRQRGTILLRTLDQPEKVLLWQATNPKARDFRLESIGPAWQSSPVTPDEQGICMVTLAAPELGWSAFFLELTFPGPGGLPLVFTTEVVVTPDVYPFDAPGPRATSRAFAAR